MAPQFHVHHPEKPTGPLVHLQPSSPLTKRRRTQGVFFIHQVRITGMPTLQLSQLPKKVPQTASTVFLDYLLTLSYGWRAAPSLLPSTLHPRASCHNTWLANVLTCPDFPWPVSSLMHLSE